jgi:hypothetical protein
VTFKDVLAKQPIAAAGPKCSVGVWRNQLSPIDRAEFDAAAADEAVAHSVLLSAMKEMGFARQVAPLYKHRGGRCSCDVR